VRGKALGLERNPLVELAGPHVEVDLREGGREGGREGRRDEARKKEGREGGGGVATYLDHIAFSFDDLGFVPHLIVEEKEEGRRRNGERLCPPSLPPVLPPSLPPSLLTCLCSHKMSTQSLGWSAEKSSENFKVASSSSSQASSAASQDASDCRHL